MSRRKKGDLAEFQAWLMETRYIADSTASVYASTLRQVLASMGEDLSEAGVTASFKEMGMDHSRKAMNSRRSVWKHFCAFAATKGISVAQPRATPSSQSGPPEMPHDVRAALHFFARKGFFTVKQIPHLQWSMFQQDIPSVPALTLCDPYQRGQEAHIPRPHAEAMLEWSGAEIGDSTPLFPSKPGAPNAYPIPALRRELRFYRRSLALTSEPPPDEVDQAAMAEMAALLATREGDSVLDGPDKDFVPTRSTQDLHALLASNPGPTSLIPTYPQPTPPREQLPGEAGPNSGVGEEEE